MEEAEIRRRVDDILRDKMAMGAGYLDPRSQELHEYIVEGGFSGADLKRYIKFGLDALFPDHKPAPKRKAKAGVNAGVNAGYARKSPAVKSQELFAKRSKRVAKLMDAGYSRDKAWKAVMNDQVYKAKKAKHVTGKKKKAGVMAY